MKDKVYVELTKWRDKYGNKRSFIILWSDKTWDEFEFEAIGSRWDYDFGKMSDEFRDEYHKYDDCKKYFNLNSIISKHLSKEETINYINNKIEDLYYFEQILTSKYKKIK